MEIINPLIMRPSRSNHEWICICSYSYKGTFAREWRIPHNDYWVHSSHPTFVETSEEKEKKNKQIGYKFGRLFEKLST